MPPTKRAAGKSTTTRQTRAKRPRLSDRAVDSDIQATHPTDSTTATQSSTAMVSIDVNALSITISAAVAQAVQSALSQGSIGAILPHRSADRHACIEQAVASATDAIAVDSGSSTGTGDVPSQAGCSDPEQHQVFSSISVGLTSRVSGKLKGKIWANEYIDFGSLLFSSPRNEGKYSLSMTPSAGSSSQPQLTLEPCHPTKRV